MKSVSIFSKLRVLTLAGLFCAVAPASRGQDFAVTAAGLSAYVINGNNNPTLNLQRGVTYIFAFSSTGIHPFWIKSSLGFGSTGAFNSGVVNNGSTSASLSFTVPANAPDQLFYQCGNHGGMTGVLNITTPVAPAPKVQIINLVIGPTIVVTSTGTNGWSVIPEFNCDLASTNWTTVPAYTNLFSNGTNITGFDRLEAICGSPNVFIRIRNQKN